LNASDVSLAGHGRVDQPGLQSTDLDLRPLGSLQFCRFRSVGYKQVSQLGNRESTWQVVAWDGSDVLRTGFFAERPPLVLSPQKKEERANQTLELNRSAGLDDLSLQGRKQVEMSESLMRLVKARIHAGQASKRS
jgi:hypothetical protein